MTHPATDALDIQLCWGSPAARQPLPPTRLWLDPRERAVLDGPGSAAYRRQRLRARWTLRSGLADLGLVPHRPDGRSRLALTRRGAVRLVLLDGDPGRLPQQASLAHSPRAVLGALATADDRGLGVDVDEEWGTAERNVHRFGTAAELALVDTLAGTCLRPLHLWCLKEALAKATGRGFTTIPPIRYRLSACPDRTDRIRLELPPAHTGTARPFDAMVAVGTVRRDGRDLAWAAARADHPVHD